MRRQIAAAENPTNGDIVLMRVGADHEIVPQSLYLVLVYLKVKPGEVVQLYHSTSRGTT